MPRTNHGSRALAVAFGTVFACADGQTDTTPAETTGSTVPSTTATAETAGTGTDVSTGSTSMDTTPGTDTLRPWYGVWYGLDSQIVVNQPEWWGDGGDSLGFTLFELRADGATMWVKDCFFGNSQYDYTLLGDDDAVVLEPIGGAQEFLPYGELERLYLDPGDCSVLGVRALWASGKESEFFSWADGLKRGELCLECAPTQGTQGTVTDCGTPVPWECPG